MSPTRLLAVARKETLQLRRDPRSLMLAFALPVLLLILFGYAISWDVRDIRAAMLDQDHSASSRDLVDAFRSSGYFTVVRVLGRSAETGPLLERGGAQLILVIPPGFERDLGAGRAAPVQAILDGSDANTATIAQGYAEAVVRTWSGRAVLRGRAVTPPVSPESRVWFNEELASRNMIVPGLVAVIMMIIAAMLTSLTIAREWERGTMEQLAATPVTRLEVVLGKLLPYLAIGLIDVIGCSVLGVLLFRVPFRGNAALLMLLSACFLTGALGLGLVSAYVRRLKRGQGPFVDPSPPESGTMPPCWQLSIFPGAGTRALALGFALTLTSPSQPFDTRVVWITLATPTHSKYKRLR